MQEPISSIIVLKSQFRRLYEMFDIITEKDKLDALVDDLKTKLKKGEIQFPCTEQAIEVFYELWNNQRGLIQRPFAMRAYIDEKQHEVLMNKVQTKEKVPQNQQSENITYKMCSLLATSILMIIKLYETDAPIHTFDSMKIRVQELAKLAISEEYKEKPSKILYHELLTLQTNILSILSRV